MRQVTRSTLSVVLLELPAAIVHHVLLSNKDVKRRPLCQRAAMTTSVRRCNQVKRTIELT